MSGGHEGKSGQADRAEPYGHNQSISLAQSVKKHTVICRSLLIIK
jgi:hypothetical protein